MARTTKTQDTNHETGLKAETWSVFYLRLQGYRILARRMRNQEGEIDIIATQDNTVVFIEVKARPVINDLDGIVSRRQQGRIIRAAELFLAGRPALQKHDVRFDLMVVTPDGGPYHIENAWDGSTTEATYASIY